MIDQTKIEFLPNVQDCFSNQEYDLTYSTFLKEVAMPVYRFLNNNQRKNGTIYDPYIRSNLDFQYQTSYYILSSVLLENFTYGDKFINNVEYALKYLTKIGYDINRRANSFIGIAIALSCYYCNSIELRKKLSKYLQSISFSPALEQQKKSANNFYALKGLAHLLRAHIISGNLSDDDLKCGETIILTHLMNWQLPDGIFYDKPFEFESTDYVPHLTYHATMMMVMAFSGRILSNDRMMERANKALIALIALTSPAGEAFGYGRSNHAIFGYANAILGCSLLSDFYTDQQKEISSYRNLLFNYIIKHRHLDGHLYIVPNHLEDKRAGFDSYMFVMVYESYALAMLLLSHLIQPLYSEKRE